MNVIEVQNLRKEFKSFSSRSGLSGAFRDLFTRNYKVHAAVDNISLHIKQGEMVGYIGENGAGKSLSIGRQRCSQGHLRYLCRAAVMWLSPFSGWTKDRYPSF